MAHVPPPLIPATDSLEEQLAIETPEQVTLQLPVAGIAMRGVALLLDSLFIGIALGALALLGRAIPGASDLGRALLIALAAAVYLGYYLVFEFVTHGRTPGKMLLRLRVVDYQGQPPATSQLLIRNLLRLADIALIAVGIQLFIIFWSPRNQRLGDLAAGTLVIRDSDIRLADVEQAMARQEFLSGQGAQGTAGLARRLRPAEIELVRRYLERSASLTPTQRLDLAHRLAAQLTQSLGHPASLAGLAPEEQLRRIWAAIQQQRDL